MGAVAGLLLTGGAGRRMGRDKASLVVDGVRLADRGAGLLSALCAPVLEVGPGRTGLPAVREDPPGGGPLAAVAAGALALRGRDHRGAALVLAVDLPLVTEDLLRLLLDHPGSAVPISGDIPQPLCARYSAAALARATEAVSRGERSMRALLPNIPDLRLVPPETWQRVAGRDALADVDTPEDLRRLGLGFIGETGRAVEQ